MDQNDAFGLVLFDEKIRSIFPTRGSGSHFRALVDGMSKVGQASSLSDRQDAGPTAEPGGKTDVGGALLTIAPQIKRRGLVFVISDFIADLERLSLGLGQMSFLGQDVVLLHVEDPIEGHADGRAVGRDAVRSPDVAPGQAQEVT
jgi:uncharacterized protein (DUF58 family)